MNYCINPDDSEPIFLLDAQIGRDDAEPNEPYINAQEFVRELLYVDSLGKKRIQVWINSPGGYVKDGMQIYHCILATKTKVDTYCVGMAYSIAGVIFQAGRKRYMMDYATLMYHDAFTAAGTKDKSLEVTNAAIAQMISGRSWKDVEAVRKMMAKTSFISAEDAHTSGLCDEVENVSDFNKPRVTAEAELKASWKNCNEYVNKVLTPQYKNQIKPSMKKIAKLLNLNEEASEDAIAQEVQKVLNKSKEAETLEENLSTAKKNLKKAEDDFTAFKNKMEEEEVDRKAKAKLKEEADKKAKEEKEAKDMEDKKNAEIADRQAKAKERILNLNKTRGTMLTDDVLETYISLAVTSEENCVKAEKAIEAIPVTRGANFKNMRTVKDETGIPLIQPGIDVEANRSPIGKAAGDTTAVIDAINSFQFHKHKGKVAI